MRYALAALLLLGACASTSETASAPAGRDCFRNLDIDGYEHVDDDTIAVRVSPGRRYTLSAPRLGRDIRWNMNIAVRADSGWICTGNGLGVYVIGGTPDVRRIPVTAIARLETPAPAPEAAPESAPAPSSN